MLPRTLLKGKNFRDKLYSDKYLSGVWSTLGSENIAHIMASSGLDYILIDLEHGLGGFDTVSKQVLSVLSLDTAVVVRLPDHSESSIKRILDAGANAILVPQVNNFDQVQDIINYSLFAPEGRRGVAVGQIPASDFGYKPEYYFANANKSADVVNHDEEYSTDVEWVDHGATYYGNNVDPVTAESDDDAVIKAVSYTHLTLPTNREV